MSNEDQSVAPVKEDVAQQTSTEQGVQGEPELSLDDLLKQFEGGQSQEQPTKQPEQQQDDLAERLKALEQRTYQEQFQKDVTKVVEQIRGDLDADKFDNTFVEAWLDAEARKDPKLAKAWEKRNDDPASFKKVVNALGKKFSGRFSDMPDKRASDDRAVVADAVRNGATKQQAAQSPSYGGMTDAEYRKKIESDYGYTPNF